MLRLEVDFARMGEIKVGRGVGKIGCLGLGSCIGLIAYDSRSKVGGIAHVVLPDSAGRTDIELPARYMDLALNKLIDALFAQGVSKHRLKFAAVGGANVFRFGAGASNLNLEIGARNSEALALVMTANRAELVAERLGGHKATSTQLCLETGKLYVAQQTREFELLCNFMEESNGNRAA
jgi:chemotaxis protein CheD